MPGQGDWRLEIINDTAMDGIASMHATLTTATAARGAGFHITTTYTDRVFQRLYYAPNAMTRGSDLSELTFAWFNPGISNSINYNQLPDWVRGSGAFTRLFAHATTQYRNAVTRGNLPDPRTLRPVAPVVPAMDDANFPRLGAR
jgi:hypothetical protein